jgi:hypothetical protein
MYGWTQTSLTTMPRQSMGSLEIATTALVTTFLIQYMPISTQTCFVESLVLIMDSILKASRKRAT